MTAYNVTWGTNCSRTFTSLEQAFAFRNKLVRIFPRLANFIKVSGEFSEE